MLLQRDRTREAAKGLASIFVRELSPNLETAYNDLGWLSDDGTTLDPQAQVIEHKDEGGNLSKISTGETSHKFSSYLAQVGQDEIDFIKNSASKAHSIRYYGMMNPWRFQYKCAEFAQIVPYIPRTWKAGKQNLPLTAFFLKQDNSVFDTPEYYDAECLGNMFLDNMVLWLSPRRALNTATTRILDMSGYAYHNVLSDVGIWQDGYLRFNGSTYNGSFGDNLDIDNSDGSFMFDFWLRILGDDATTQIIFSKKATTGSTDAGFWLERTSANKLKFYISNGAVDSELTSVGNVTKNVWQHFLVHTCYQTAQKTRLYINGLIDNEQDALADFLPSTNAVNFYLARGGASYGQVDIGDFRIHKSTTVLDGSQTAYAHWLAERSYYSV